MDQQQKETLEQEIGELRKENRDLREKCEELEKKLRVYENPHIPSSKHIIRKIQVKSEPKKRGAPKGHKGATRKTPTPAFFVNLEPKTCPNCNDSKKIGIIRERKTVSEDIRIVKDVTEFHFYDCHCGNCNRDFTTGDPELPMEGRFGPDICSLWTQLYYVGCVPFDRLSRISGNCLGIGITPAGLENVIHRTAQIFEPNYKRIWENVANSRNVSSDETGISFNGKGHWYWNISSRSDVLVLIRKSRGSKVLEEIFGEFLDGIMSSDCFSAYGKFKAREYQKCWAHILRDAKDLAKRSEEGRELYRTLSGMYAYITKAKENGQENSAKVLRWAHRAKQKLCSLVKKNYGSKAIINLVLRLVKYKNDWFTCLKHKDVEPTNNGSERNIRKFVTSRKISGAHRSEVGMHCREIMMSAILTLEKTGQNPFEFVLNGVRTHNSGG